MSDKMTMNHEISNLELKKLDEIRAKFGDEYLEKEKRKVNTATLTGVWSWEVYPDAVCYFLKEESRLK